VSSKYLCLPFLVWIIVISPIQGRAQDSWTDSWKLVWSYDAQLISDYHIVAFDIYKDITASRVTFFKSVAPSLRDYRDTALQPNTTYYYRLTVRDDSGRTSGYSQAVYDAIPYILPALDLIEFRSELTFNLNDPRYVVDKDLGDQAYAGNLRWWINDGLVYQSADDALTIRVVDQSTLSIRANHPGVVGQDTVFLTVVDPDSFWYKKQTVIRYGVDPVTALQQDSLLTFDTEFAVFPLPFRAAEHQGITFKNLPSSASVMIYNVLGEPVFIVRDLPARTWIWDVKNTAGKPLNAGLYIYHVMDATGNRKYSGKLVVVR